MLKESGILLENGQYWVMKSEHHKGFDIYKTGITHSTRVAQIGFEGDEGMKRCITEISRRQSIDIQRGTT